VHAVSTSQPKRGHTTGYWADEVLKPYDKFVAAGVEVVVATPDGASPHADVSLKPGHSVTETEIIDFCRERIAHFKCPAAVEFADLPKTSTGKVQKYLLGEKGWIGREKRIN
jgi:acyl-CoA synthetase (AMP-forming)/AMP-acid ligase II